MLVLAYLFAIVAANLLTAAFGPGISVVNALVLVALDLTTRDSLHERWHGRWLWPRMAGLILAGSVLSWLLNAGAGRIALASCIAFALSGAADALTYTVLGRRARLVRVNGSNVVSAAVDSWVFLWLAFGWQTALVVAPLQWLAKVLGGLVWSVVLNRADVTAWRRSQADAWSSRL